MFYSNIFFLTNALSEYVSRNELIALIRTELELSLRRAQAYMKDEEYREVYHHLLESGTWQASCLLRMRLAATEKYIAIDDDNPLHLA